MITAKTKALLVAMTLLGAAPAAIPALADNTSIVSIEDNDEVKQENDVDVKQKCKQENESGDDALQVVGIDAQSNTCANTAVVVAANNNEDNDANVVVTAQDDRDVCDLIDLLTLNVETTDC